MRQLRDEDELTKLPKLQGICRGLELALGIPSKLLEVAKQPGGQ